MVPPSGPFGQRILQDTTELIWNHDNRNIKNFTVVILFPYLRQLLCDSLIVLNTSRVEAYCAAWVHLAERHLLW